jgi:drug/metabolite transporter (DMT)-like permease
MAGPTRFVGSDVGARPTNTAIPFVLISWGKLHIDSAVAAVLNSTVPLFTMIIAHLFLSDDHLTLPRLIGLLT